MLQPLPQAKRPCERPHERPLFPPLPTLQNLRGGRVKLQSIMMPEMEFSHADKGGWQAGRKCAGGMLGAARPGAARVTLRLRTSKTALPATRGALDT